jgi:hypothetical protein
MIVTCEGLSVVLLEPENEAEEQELLEAVDVESWQFVGKAIAIDTRLAEDVMNMLAEQGIPFTTR